ESIISSTTLIVQPRCYRVGRGDCRVRRILGNLGIIVGESCRLIATSDDTFTIDGFKPCAGCGVYLNIQVKMITILTEIVSDNTCTPILDSCAGLYNQIGVY